MTRCSGRCVCHRAAWDVLDEAAGITRANGKHTGRKPYETDADVWRAKLREAYWAEAEAEPDKKPSYRRVGIRLSMERRTVKTTCERLGVSFPPDPRRDLRGRAAGRARTIALIRRSAA